MGYAFPYCIRADIERKFQQFSIDATSTPDNDTLDRYAKEISQEINLTLQAAGYNLTTLYDVSDSVALAISSVSFDVVDGSQFAVGETIKLEGTDSGVPVWEFQSIIAISSNTLILGAITNDYDAGAVIKVVNNALGFLRNINAVGAAWMSEQAAVMQVAPNAGEHAETLRLQYYGSEDSPGGLWAIKNIPGFLDDAPNADDLEVEAPLPQSYAAENSNDTDVQKLEIDYKW